MCRIRIYAYACRHEVSFRLSKCLGSYGFRQPNLRIKKCKSRGSEEEAIHSPQPCMDCRPKLIALRELHFLYQWRMNMRRRDQYLRAIGHGNTDNWEGAWEMAAADLEGAAKHRRAMEEILRRKPVEKRVVGVDYGAARERAERRRNGGRTGSWLRFEVKREDVVESESDEETETEGD